MRDGVLVACFVKKDDARQAVRILAQKGLFRTTVLHKDKNGQKVIRDPFIRRRLLGYLVSLVFCLSVTALVAYLVKSPISSLPFSPFAEKKLLRC